MNDFLLLGISETLNFIIFLIGQGIVDSIEDAANSKIHEGGNIVGFPRCTSRVRTSEGVRFFTITAKGKVYPICAKTKVYQLLGETVKTKYILLTKEKAES